MSVVHTCMHEEFKHLSVAHEQRVTKMQARSVVG